MWYFLLANCNPKLLPDNTTNKFVEIGSGQIEWKNPYGYLPGQIVAHLPIYWTLGILYFLFLIFWFVLSCIYQRGLMTLQMLIALVILICVLEAVVWGTGYTIYNFEGKIYYVSIAFGAFFSAVKNTALRLLLLVVGLGLSITRPKLEIMEYICVTVITVVYFIADTIFELQKLSRDAGEAPIWAPIEWIAASALFIVDIAFFGWITFSTYTTMMELKSEGQSFKFSQYKTLVICIIFCLGLSVVLGIMEVIVDQLQISDEFFKWWWIWEMYWKLANLATIVTLGLIWRPSENNKQYAHSQQLSQEDPDAVGNASDTDIKLDEKKNNENKPTPKSTTTIEKSDQKVTSEGNVNLNSDSDDSYTSSSL